MALKQWLRVAAASALYFGIASADDDECSAHGPETDTTIHSQGDWDALAPCLDFLGNITVGSDLSGELDLGDDLTELNHYFTLVDATQLTSLDAPALGHVTIFDAEGLTVLSSLNLPRLARAEDFTLHSLPALSQLSFTHGLTRVLYLRISDTFLASTDGIDPTDEVRSVYIADNKYLQDVTMDSFAEIDDLTVSGNGGRLRLSFAALANAGQLTVRNASAIALPALHFVGDALTLAGNGVRELLLPNLTGTDGPFTIRENGDLRSLSLPLLDTVYGDLVIDANPKLTAISLPALKTVRGALRLQGNFSSLDLPAIETVEGGLWIDSSEIPCGTYDSTPWMHPGNGVVEGGVSFQCSVGHIQGGDGVPVTTVGSASSDTSFAGPTSSSSVTSATSVTSPAAADASATGGAGSAATAAAASASASGSAAPTTVAGSAGSKVLVGSGALFGGLIALMLVL